MNLLHFMWLSYTFIITLSGLSFLYVKCLPHFLQELYAFGKVHDNLSKNKNIFSFLLVPKRWFSHFYVFASIHIPVITATVLLKYFGIHSCYFLNKVLDVFATPKRQAANVLPESVVITGILLSLQVLRRCYECHFISIYSDSKMNILHYIVGITFYFGVGLSFIHDAPGFESNFDGTVKAYISGGNWLLWRHFIGASLFLSAFILQFETNKAFAALRKKDEKVVSLGHFMPTGGGFEYVSCPHYFAEIVMYLSACIVLGGKSYTWWLVCLWTVINQTLTGLTSHRWYKDKFKHYPANRKAIIPFLL